MCTAANPIRGHDGSGSQLLLVCYTASIMVCIHCRWFDTNYHYLVPELDANSSPVPRYKSVTDKVFIPSSCSRLYGKGALKACPVFVCCPVHPLHTNTVGVGTTPSLLYLRLCTLALFNCCCWASPTNTGTVSSTGQSSSLRAGCGFESRTSPKLSRKPSAACCDVLSLQCKCNLFKPSNGSLDQCTR